MWSNPRIFINTRVYGMSRKSCRYREGYREVAGTGISESENREMKGKTEKEQKEEKTLKETKLER